MRTASYMIHEVGSYMRTGSYTRLGLTLRAWSYMRTGSYMTHKAGPYMRAGSYISYKRLGLTLT